MIYPWQQAQWQQLLGQYQQKRLPHALLLTGPRGLGKKDFALAVSKLVLCENAQPIACDQCRSCQLFRAESHPDFFKVYPEEESKNIKIDQIRHLTQGLNQTAQRLGYQVALIYPAEAMNMAAANALLKTLEEPPGRVLLLLVAHRLAELPATVLSRCQRLAFSAVEVSLLKIADKNYLALRDQCLQYWLAICQAQHHPIKGVNEFLKLDLELVIQIYFLIAIDLLRLQLNISVDYLVNKDKLSQLQTLKKVISKTTLLKIIAQLPAMGKLLQGSIHVNLHLLLEGLFLSLVDAC